MTLNQRLANVAGRNRERLHRVPRPASPRQVEVREFRGGRFMSIKEVRSMLTRKQINRLRQLTIEDRSAFDATLRRAVNHYLSARIPNWRAEPDTTAPPTAA